MAKRTVYHIKARIVSSGNIHDLDTIVLQNFLDTINEIATNKNFELLEVYTTKEDK